MARIIVTAEVENAGEWEKRFRTHADLFRRQTAVSPMSFTVTAENQAVIFAEAEDLGTFMELLDSEETAQAMAQDGVKRETVKVYVLDKELNL